MLVSYYFLLEDVFFDFATHFMLGGIMLSVCENCQNWNSLNHIRFQAGDRSESIANRFLVVETDSMDTDCSK